MAINKKLIHFETFSNFNSQKLSANKENTQYTLGINGEIQTGSPDILYQSIVYIKDTKQQWTHGQLYNKSIPIEISASELRKKAFLGELIPEQEYLIVDYLGIHPEYFEDIMSILRVEFRSNINFNILVQANSNSSLNKIAKLNYLNSPYDDLEGVNIKDEFNNWKIEYDLYGKNHIFSSLDTIYSYVPVTTITHPNRNAYTLFHSRVTNFAFWQLGEPGTLSNSLSCIFSKFNGNQSPDVTEIDKYSHIELNLESINQIFKSHNGVITYMCDNKGNEAHFDFITCHKYNNFNNIFTPAIQIDPIFAPLNAVNCQNNKIGPYYENGLLSIPPVFIGPFANDYMNSSTSPIYSYKNNIITNVHGELMLCGSNNTINNSGGYYYGDDNIISESQCVGTFFKNTIRQCTSNIGESIKYIIPQIMNTHISDSLLNITYWFYWENLTSNFNIESSNLENVSIKPFEHSCNVSIIASDINNCSLGSIIYTGMTGCESVVIKSGQYSRMYLTGGLIRRGVYINNVSTIVEGIYIDTPLLESCLIVDDDIKGYNIIPCSDLSKWRKNYNLQESQKYSQSPLCFIALTDDLSVKFTNALQYSIDDCVTWVNLEPNTATPVINTGDKIYFRANLTPTESGIGTFEVRGTFNLAGNIMSLLYPDNFSNAFSLSRHDYAFVNLFENCTGLYKIISDILPARTLSNSCYSRMFYNCSNLISVPETLLPALNLYDNCYHAMFYNCVNLSNTPKLPANQLFEYCYSKMFYGCKSLISTPELPAMYLAPACYFEMFRYCSGLVNTYDLPALILENDCYNSMFRECTNLTYGPSIYATTVSDYCCNAMFYGCFKLIYVGDLKATELKPSCYNAMFYRCTSLVDAPRIFATTLDSYCCNAMFYQCNKIVSISLNSQYLVDNCYRYMFAGCTSLNNIQALFITEPSSEYTDMWVYGVSSTGTFVKNAAATWNVIGDNGIPPKWTIQTI